MNLSSIVLAMLMAISCNKAEHKPNHNFSGKYDVGGHKLFLSSYGNNKPAVILESGIGDCGSMGGWTAVQLQVKEFAQICAYDRAGLGKSQKGPGTRNSQQIATELHSLLKAAKINPPYIFVGHSLGGLHIQTYAKLYPEDISAMVFVDPTPKELIDTLSAEACERVMQSGASQAVMDEITDGLNESIPLFKELPKLPDVPVVVLTSSFTGEGEVSKEQWLEFKGYHQELADQVTDGQHIIATNSSHYIQLDEPKLIVDAIKNVYDKVK